MKSALICMLQLHKNSGSARTAFENIRYFKSKGYEVHVVSMTIDKDSIKAEGAIPHKVLPWFKGTGMWRRRWYNWQVQILRQKLNPSITVGHGDIQQQDVLTLHNCVFFASELIHGKPLDPQHEMAQTHGPILKNQSFKKMIANSELMKSDTVKRFGVTPEKIEVVYPALETHIFKPVAEKKAELRKRFSFPDKVIVSLVTSGNFKKRGLDIFIEAIEALPDEIKALANFRVMGKDDPGALRSSLLTFDPGLDDIQNYYNAIDVFVLPARIEEFGRVVLEAMGCGLPVITTDKVGAGELLTGASREFVIPSHNATALKEALIKLITSKEKRLELGSLNAKLALNDSEANVSLKFDKVFLALK
ncbi:MAG TPA: glycosyltransferase family 4 protein [Bacteriovoracaceae bacterium]|nr:glycosyltransferase family 4 protein [Bacteriovoracaceae bacterium]